ncbi:hypothetical protein [Loktanella sp. S4079]|uniref:hypothetical protein n=1 Tax=Loktanella sp. S4079 TaxID=579483 RepID=UPI0005FA17DE|nr:hypothetical protein [Loktanella sp. S4079]KJZ18027.1 hypothetical protein TW80_16180 [Loktanella sp. S4079]
MFSYLVAYFVPSMAIVMGLAFMIFKIGDRLSDCPASKTAAKVGAMTIATSFVTIGFGGVLIIAAFCIGLMPERLHVVLVPALGLAALCLGLGFTHAVASLRDITARAANPVIAE